MMKINKEIIQKLKPLFLAIAEGKVIQINEGAVWVDIDIDGEGIDVSTLIACPECYRIKPEVKFRPFANAKECWEEMKKHQPFGWIKSKEDGSRSLITLIISEENIDINCIGGFNSDKIMKRFTFDDGAVFGILEEE